VRLKREDSDVIMVRFLILYIYKGIMVISSNFKICCDLGFKV